MGICSGFRSCLRSNWLTLATFTGVLMGAILGIALRVSSESKWSARDAMYLSFIGDLFLQALKSIIIPLIVPSLIIAIGTLDLSLSGKIGGRAVCYYMCTTLVSLKTKKNEIKATKLLPPRQIKSTVRLCRRIKNRRRQIQTFDQNNN